MTPEPATCGECYVVNADHCRHGDSLPCTESCMEVEPCPKHASVDVLEDRVDTLGQERGFAVEILGKAQSYASNIGGGLGAEERLQRIFHLCSEARVVLARMEAQPAATEPQPVQEGEAG